jgi:hypothetical protein
MTTRAAAVYGVGGVLLVACLAAANMPQEADPVSPSRTARAARPAPDALALEVSTQAERLRARMAQAPSPGVTNRNPFSFGTARAARSAPSAAHATAAATTDTDAAPIVSPPPLTLMGVAEEIRATGPHRTAIIALRQAQGDPEQSRGVGGDGDTIFMVGEGDAVGDRYRVTKIGADAVELEDLQTKAYRRLALR